jgi:hypothetical protein
MWRYWAARRSYPTERDAIFDALADALHEKVLDYGSMNEYFLACHDVEQLFDLLSAALDDC